jgi:hypothetical protein
MRVTDLLRCAWARSGIEHLLMDPFTRLPELLRAEVHDIVPRQHDLAEQIADLRATTLAGLRVKAAVLLSYCPYDSDSDPIWDNHDGLLGWSLARDLCGDAAARPDGAFT